jgi:hypothetical protein
MDILIALFVHYRADTTNPAALRVADALHLDVWSVPAGLGLCIAAGAAAAAAVVHRLRPVPEAGQVWVARRRQARGITVRITAGITGSAPAAVVLTPPPGPLAAELAGASILLPLRGRRLPGFRLQIESGPTTTSTQRGS